MTHFFHLLFNALVEYLSKTSLWGVTFCSYVKMACVSFLSLMCSVLMNCTFPGSKAFQTGLRVDNMRDWLRTVCRAEIELSWRRPQPRLQAPPQGETQTLLQMAWLGLSGWWRSCCHPVPVEPARTVLGTPPPGKPLQVRAGRKWWFPTLNSACSLSGAQPRWPFRAQRLTGRLVAGRS